MGLETSVFLIASKVDLRPKVLTEVDLLRSSAVHLENQQAGQERRAFSDFGACRFL